MSFINVIVVRRKVARTLTLQTTIGDALARTWSAYRVDMTSCRRGEQTVGEVVCDWVDGVQKMGKAAIIGDEESGRLAPYGFCMLRDTIRPMWDRADKRAPGNHLSKLGVAIITGAAQALWQRYKYSQLGVWRAYMIRSSRPIAFSVRTDVHSIDDAGAVVVQHNELVMFDPKLSKCMSSVGSIQP